MIGLLVIVYILFVSLGMVEPLLGGAWPTMYSDIGADPAVAGVISMFIAGSTILAGIVNARFLRRFGAGVVFAISVGLMGLALFGFSISSSFVVLLLLAIPLGFGVGHMDVGANSFVTAHYKPQHVNWLHGFWALGASIGPMIMAFGLVQFQTWRAGYRMVGGVHLILLVVVLALLPLWRRASAGETEAAQSEQETPGLLELSRLKGAKVGALTLFFAGGMELATGLWGSTYLVMIRGVAPYVATGWMAMFYGGLTLGRFLGGFLVMRLSDRQMVRLGQGLMLLGLLIIALPFNALLLPGLLLMGFGASPIFPNILLGTPRRFGVRYNSAMIGFQMAFAYAGISFLPPIFGLVGTTVGYAFFPLFLAVLLGGMIATSTMLYRRFPEQSK
ncbi:MAG: MFS transporter [Oscillospiraceae bacterium]|nr:MFS transporter [Oscillospiraceae bacterium]